MNEDFSYDDIKISIKDENLRRLIRDQVDDALEVYKYKFALWVECYLEYHGISLKQYLVGDDYYTVQTVDSNGQTVQKRIYDRALKLKNTYTAVSASMAQAARAIPDFMAVTDNYAMNEVANTTAKLIKKEWERSKTSEEADGGFWNEFLFGEIIFRTFYDEEKRDRHEVMYDEETRKKKIKVLEDKVVYRGVKAKLINSFEFIPSPEWKIDIQDAPWVAIRKFKTPQEIQLMYPDLFGGDEYATQAAYYDGANSKEILNPFANIREVYKAKIDPETRDVISSMMGDLQVSRSWDDHNLVETIEYFNKDLDARVVMIGDKLAEAEYMEDDFYPLVARKSSRDLLSARGVSDVEQALPLAQAADGIFDMKMKNLVLQLSSVLMYNTKYFPETPSFSPGSAIGVELRPGEHLDGDVMTQTSKYSQNFEIRNEQGDLERKVYSIQGINEFMAGMPSQGSDASAREAMIRQSAATANLDKKIRDIESYVYTEIANQWISYIAERYEHEFVFSLIDDSTTKYFLYLGDVEVDDSDEDYILYDYKGSKFWEPKNDIDKVLERIIIEMQSENPGEQQSPMDFMSLGMNDLAVDEDEVPKVKGLVGKWSDFVQRIIDETGGKIQAVLTRGELQGLMIKFNIKATQGVAMNKEMKKTGLLQLAPYITQMGPQALGPFLRMLIKTYDFSIDEVMPQLVDGAQKAQQPNAALIDPNGQVVSQGPADQMQAQMGQMQAGQDPMREALRPENMAAALDTSLGNLPMNTETTQNPGGINV